MQLLIASSTPLVDWAGLGKVFLVSALFALGVVFIMSISILAFSDASTHSGGRKITSTALGGFGILVIAAIVAFGIYIITAK
jgi:hypothetical protein